MVAVFLTQDGRFFLNLSRNVGPRQPNEEADVQLVQLGYYCMALSPRSTALPVDKEKYQRVVVGSQYSGAADDPLSLAILANQATKGGIQDGHVSPMKGAAIYSQRGVQAVFLIIPLMNSIKDMIPDAFPRIDKHPLCPDALKAAIRNLLMID